MAKKNRRKKHRQRYEVAVSKAQPTPTHFIRLERLPVKIDESRKWYVVRVNSKAEAKVQKGLEEAGFSTYRPIEPDMVRRRGRVYEIGKRPAAGYLFVGVDPASCGHQELWAYYDRVVYDSCAVQDRPFFRVMGPFGTKQLTRFAERIRPQLVAALWYNGEVLGHFPANRAGIVEGERILLTNVLPTLETDAA